MNHYLLVGAGGTASYLFAVLYKWLREIHGENFMLATMDADTVKTENLARQNHGEGSIGQNKAVSLVGKAPQTVAMPEYIGPKNIERVIQDGTTVIITVDNTSARKRIEDRASELNDVVVINAGNEVHTSSVQLWIRKGGQNITPPLSFLHPEIVYKDDEDRALISCEDVDALAGGGQTAVANHSAALGIMMALNHAYFEPLEAIKWHELHMDALTGEVERIDYRESKAWINFSSQSESSPSSQPSAEASSGSAITPPARRTRNTSASSNSHTRP